jgi:hypothetical protein
MKRFCDNSIFILLALACIAADKPTQEFQGKVVGVPDADVIIVRVSEEVHHTVRLVGR